MCSIKTAGGDDGQGFQTVLTALRLEADQHLPDVDDHALLADLLARRARPVE